jgi:hypothetical protein
VNANLLAQWKKDLVGDWVQELAGTDLLYLQPVQGQTCQMTLRADGTAASRAGSADEPAVPSRPEAPFPETWELSEDRVLSFVFPIPPMPEYEMPDWGRERMQYDVLNVTDLSLALSDRRFDGELVTVWRRVNREEHNRRKAAEYLQALEAIKRLAGGGRA